MIEQQKTGRGQCQQCAARDRRGGEDLYSLIKGSGAFSRFKNAINSMGIDKAWHQFRQTEFEKLAIEWLEDEEIPYTRDNPPEVSNKAM